MSKFMNPGFSTTHPGVERLENAAFYLKSLSASLNSSRTLAALLVTAVVAALLVAANQLIDTITDGHLFAVWICLWAVGFAAMALLKTPALTVVRSLRRVWGQWRHKQRMAAQDAQLWELAGRDSRVMADIRAAASLSD